MAPKIGDPAPNFALPRPDGQVVSLGDLRGRWTVLYFYPKDDTPGCTTEACEFTDRIDSFGNLDACVVGVNADTPQEHQAFIEKYGLGVDLLSDPEHHTLESYGVWGEQEWQGRRFMGVSRQTFLVDPQGRVAWHWPKVKAQGHAQEVRQKLEDLRREAGSRPANQ